MRVNQRLLLRNSLAVLAAGAICASLAACGSSSASSAKVPMTDAEIKDFLLQSDSDAMVADSAGYAAVAAAASAQRDALTKARGAEVDSTDITQVKADGEVTLSALRARIDALAGRTLANEDSRIQAALSKVTASLRGSDKKAITDALASLNETVTSVEKAVSQRENPGAGDGTGSGTTVEEPREETGDGTRTPGNGGGGGPVGGGNAGAGADTGGNDSDRSQNGRQEGPGEGQPDPGAGGGHDGDVRNPPADPGAPNQPGGGEGDNRPAPEPGAPPAVPGPGGDQGGGDAGGPAVPDPQPGAGEAPQQP